MLALNKRTESLHTYTHTHTHPYTHAVTWTCPPPLTVDHHHQQEQQLRVPGVVLVGLHPLICSHCIRKCQQQNGQMPFTFGPNSARPTGTVQTGNCNWKLQRQLQLKLRWPTETVATIAGRQVKHTSLAKSREGQLLLSCDLISYSSPFSHNAV